MTQNDLHTFIRLFDSELRLYRPGWSSRIEGEGGNTARLWANGSTVGLDLLQDSVSPNPKPDPILQAVIGETECANRWFITPTGRNKGLAFC